MDLQGPCSCLQAWIRPCLLSLAGTTTPTSNQPLWWCPCMSPAWAPPLAFTAGCMARGRENTHRREHQCPGPQQLFLSPDETLSPVASQHHHAHVYSQFLQLRICMPPGITPSLSSTAGCIPGGRVWSHRTLRSSIDATDLPWPHHFKCAWK